MDKQVKVKILDMTYDKDNNLFQMEIEELVGEHLRAILAVAGEDFGIAPDVPVEIAEQFCEEMKGKEKNLHVQRDYSSLRDAVKNEDGTVSHTEIEKINKNMDSYPIDKVMNKLYSESKEKDNES